MIRNLIIIINWSPEFDFDDISSKFETDDKNESSSSKNGFDLLGFLLEFIPCVSLFILFLLSLSFIFLGVNIFEDNELGLGGGGGTVFLIIKSS